MVKGGLSVDVGVRAFMPASRSGARDAAEMEKLVGQEIRCRITKLDVDRRRCGGRPARGCWKKKSARARNAATRRLKEGEIVHGTVRSLMDYGAFVDIGGIDGLLHVADISWSRVKSPPTCSPWGRKLKSRF